MEKNAGEYNKKVAVSCKKKLNKKCIKQNFYFSFLMGVYRLSEQ